MQKLIYSLVKTSNETFEFTTSKGIVYRIYFTNLVHLNHLFEQEKTLKSDNFYYLILEKKTNKEINNRFDLIIKRTVASCIFQFFVDNKQAIILFNYSNGGGKVVKRRNHFNRWFKEYADGTRFVLYRKDYLDFASICALYKIYSSHPNFVEIEQNIKSLIEKIGTETSKNN